jgi:hypothetical protein
MLEQGEMRNGAAVAAETSGLQHPRQMILAGDELSE